MTTRVVNEGDNVYGSMYGATRHIYRLTTLGHQLTFGRWISSIGAAAKNEATVGTCHGDGFWVLRALW